MGFRSMPCMTVPAKARMHPQRMAAMTTGSLHW